MHLCWHLRRAVGAELPWGIGVCAFTLAPDHPEVLLVPDMKADARFNSMCAFISVARSPKRTVRGLQDLRVGGVESTVKRVGAQGLAVCPRFAHVSSDCKVTMRGPRMSSSLRGHERCAGALCCLPVGYWWCRTASRLGTEGPDDLNDF